MIELIKFIIERDFIIKQDDVLPTLVLFLAREKHPLSLEFIKFFVEWGVVSLDKRMEDQDFITSIKFKAENLLKYFAFQKEDHGIITYRLLGHWRDAINDFSERVFEWKEVKKRVEPRIKHFLLYVVDALKNEKLVLDPSNDIFVVIADIATLFKEKEILKCAYFFLKDYKKYRDTKQYILLKERLISLLKDQSESDLNSVFKHPLLPDVARCNEALKLITYAIELEPADAKLCAELHFLASQCHEILGNFEEALENCKIAIKFNPTNIKYYADLGNLMEKKGRMARNMADYAMAMISYSEAIETYKKALNIIENLSPSERGIKKKEESYLWWQIGRCYKKLQAVEKEFNYGDTEELRNDLKQKFQRLYQESQDLLREGNYEGALEKLEEAKCTIMEYVETIKAEEQEEMLKNVYDLICEVYKKLGLYNERLGRIEESSRYYLIYLDLKEYSENSVGLYLKYANKFRGWKLYENSIYCLYKALKFKPDDFTILSELADLCYKIGELEQGLKYLKRSLEIQKSTAGFVTESDIDLLHTFKKRIKNRKFLSDALCALCDVADLAIEGAQPYLLSKALYNAYNLLRKIHPSMLIAPFNSYSQRVDVINELNNLKLCCLSRALLLNKNNYKAKKEFENLSQGSLDEYLKKYSNYYLIHLKRGIQNPLDALLRVFSQTIFTMVALHAKGKLGTKKERKKLIRRLSGYWGWIGGRINKIFVDKQQINKIHPSLAVKCFKLSLKLRRKNKKSSNGLGWALLFSGEVDESIKAFERDLKEINKNNPASLIGIGRAYQEKGEYNIAAHYLKEGAKSRFDLRYEELPWLNIAVLATCAKKLEYLAFFKTLPEEKLKMLKDALEIYGMLNKIIEEITIESTRLQETKLLEDEQNLFKLKWLNLNDYINSLNQFSNI